MCDVYFVFLVTFFGVVVALFDVFRYVIGEISLDNIGNFYPHAGVRSTPVGPVESMCPSVYLCLCLYVWSSASLFCRSNRAAHNCVQRMRLLYL